MQLYAFVMGSVALMIKLYADTYREADLQATLTELEDDLSLPQIQVYDFIIVGGGTAGCVLANRLSSQYNVLLLEAGGNPVPAAAVPVFQGAVGSHPLINYKYTSVPQLNASLQDGGIITRSPGKMLGGSSSHHGLVYNRGSPYDFDAWAEATNDSSWKYENVLEYFKKSENLVGVGDAAQHGKKGPLTVDTNRIPMLPKWFVAGQELGYQTTMDPNGPQKESFSAVAITRKDGQRVSAYTAFVKALKNRKLLTIRRYSVVSEILIDQNKKAYGVAYKRHGIPQLAHASKSVIVSSGNFGSPLLLMKSGIGPADVLTSANIPVIADLPVGQGVEEHTSVPLGPFIVNDTSLLPRLQDSWKEQSLVKFASSGDGILQFGPIGAQAFMVSSRAKKDGQPNWPDVQIDFSDGFRSDKTPLELYFFVVLGRPKSRGEIRLNATAYNAGVRDDESLAIIDYKILSEPSDTDVLVEGVELALAVAENTTAFRELGAAYTAKPHPACQNVKFRSEEYWQCYVHQVGTTWLHFSSACRMGSGAGDKAAVVDSQLNVIGIRNLKVVDASVMPQVTNTNLATSVMMIAEKTAADILRQFKTVDNNLL